MTSRPPTSTLFPYTRSSDLHELACVSELVGIRIARWLAGGRSKNNGESVIRTISSRVGFWIAGKADRAIQKDRKSTRLNSSHVRISYAVFCLKKTKT